MTDNDITRAVAECMGWLLCSPNPTHGAIMGFHEKHCNPGKTRFPMPVPRYASDLNAMHEAENWLEYHCERWFVDDEGSAEASAESAFIYHLRNNVCHTDEPWQLIGATARQRAEAFLRTVGRWS